MSHEISQIVDDITRYDKNLATRSKDFLIYEQDAVLIKNLVAFFSADVHHNILQVDLFGRRILDPQTFAEHMNYKNYRSLIKKHSSPSQYKGKSERDLVKFKKDMKEKGEPLWDTILCNSIYRLRYESLRFTKAGKTPNGLETSELKELRFLKHAKKFNDPSTNRIFYEIEYDDTHINNLARYFMRFSTQAYAKLRKPGLQDLYIYLVNLRDSLKAKQMNYTDSIPFDVLCEIAGTFKTQPRQNKNYLIKAFEKINKLLNEEVDTFELTWNKNGRYYYQPVINFKFTDKELDKYSGEAIKRLKLFFKMNILKEFGQKFLINKATDELKEDSLDAQKNVIRAYKWLKDDDSDFMMKLKIYQDTYIQCFREDPDIYSSKTTDALKAVLVEIADELMIDGQNASPIS